MNTQFKEGNVFGANEKQKYASKNVSLCPIMAASITFLSTLCYVGAREQTKELLTAIGEKKKKKRKEKGIFLPIITSLFTLKLKLTGRAMVCSPT